MNPFARIAIVTAIKMTIIVVIGQAVHKAFKDSGADVTKVK